MCRRSQPPVTSEETCHLSADTTEKKAKSNTRLLLMSAGLNLFLAGYLIYKFTVPEGTPSGGVTVDLVNEMPCAITDIVFEHPRGKLELPKLDVYQQVAIPIENVGDFDATLSFKDKAGNAFKEKVRLQPFSDQMLLVFIKPQFEEAVVKTAEGKEETVVKWSPKKVHLEAAFNKHKTGH
jgi:hypothetical protein